MSSSAREPISGVTNGYVGCGVKLVLFTYAKIISDRLKRADYNLRKLKMIEASKIDNWTRYWMHLLVRKERHSVILR